MNNLFISSGDNPKVKEALDLREKRKRDQLHLFLIEGYREILRALQGKVAIEKLFFCPELFLGENEQALIEEAKNSGAMIFRCSEKVFHKLSYRDRPDGLLAIAKTMQYQLQDLEKKISSKTPYLFVIAEAIEKPGNLGTILRSADGSGAHAVLVCERCTDIYNPNVVRASVGTLFTLPVLETSNAETILWLKEHHVQIVAASPHAEKNYTDIDFTKPTALVVGAEQIGLSDFWTKNCTDFVKIPMKGAADSLNVAMATTILLYEAQRQRSL